MAVRSTEVDGRMFNNNLTDHAEDIDLPNNSPNNPLQDNNVEWEDQEDSGSSSGSSDSSNEPFDNGLIGDRELDSVTDEDTSSPDNSGSDSSDSTTTTGSNNGLTGDPEETEDAYNDWQDGEETEDTVSGITDIPKDEDYQEDLEDDSSDSGAIGNAVDKGQDLAQGWGQFLRQQGSNVAETNQKIGNKVDNFVQEKTEDPLGIQSASQNAVKAIIVLTAGGIGYYIIRSWKQ